MNVCTLNENFWSFSIDRGHDHNSGRNRRDQFVKIIWSKFRMGQDRDDDNRKDVAHFSFKEDRFV